VRRHHGPQSAVSAKLRELIVAGLDTQHTHPYLDGAELHVGQALKDGATTPTFGPDTCLVCDPLQLFSLLLIERRTMSTDRQFLPNCPGQESLARALSASSGAARATLAALTS
jgi:hypothetical protein